MDCPWIQGRGDHDLLYACGTLVGGVAQMTLGRGNNQPWLTDTGWMSRAMPRGRPSEVHDHARRRSRTLKTFEL